MYQYFNRLIKSKKLSSEENMDIENSKEDKDTILFGVLLIFLGIFLILVIPNLVPPGNYIVITSPNRTNISGGTVSTPHDVPNEEHSLSRDQKIEIATTTLNTISCLLGLISACLGLYTTHLGYQQLKRDVRRDKMLNIDETKENETKV